MVMLGNNSLWSLTRALVWRGRREQGMRLWLFPSLTISFFLGSTVLVIFEPNLLTGFTSQALMQALQHHFSSEINTNSGMALVFILIQGPYFAALMGALMASSFACAAIGTESSRGGFEIIMSAPLQLRDILLALISYITILSAISWILLIGVISISAIVALTLLEPNIAFNGWYFLSASLMPLPVILWSSLIAVSVSIYFPRIADIRSGTTNNLVQIIAILPALLIFVAANLFSGKNPLYVVIIFSVVGILGSVLTSLLLVRRYKPELFLQNI